MGVYSDKCHEGKSKLTVTDFVGEAGAVLSRRENIDKVDCETLKNSSVAEEIKDAGKELKGLGKKAVVSEIAGKVS